MKITDTELLDFAEANPLLAAVVFMRVPVHGASLPDGRGPREALRAAIRAEKNRKEGA